jgi:hypothetical protein
LTDQKIKEVVLNGGVSAECRNSNVTIKQSPLMDCSGKLIAIACKKTTFK